MILNRNRGAQLKHLESLLVLFFLYFFLYLAKINYQYENHVRLLIYFYNYQLLNIQYYLSLELFDQINPVEFICQVFSGFRCATIDNILGLIKFYFQGINDPSFVARLFSQFELVKGAFQGGEGEERPLVDEVPIETVDSVDASRLKVQEADQHVDKRVLLPRELPPPFGKFCSNPALSRSNSYAFKVTRKFKFFYDIWNKIKFSSRYCARRNNNIYI